MISKTIRLLFPSKKAEFKKQGKVKATNISKGSYKSYSEIMAERYNSKLIPGSPHAKLTFVEGNHEENLKMHKMVYLNEIDILSSLNNLPVWINHDKTEQYPSFYENIFWEVEQYGEYLYYLAGDYPKNEKGLLCFTQSQTDFRVEVNFEERFISSEEQELINWQNKCLKYKIDFDEILSLTIGDLVKLFPETGNEKILWEEAGCLLLNDYFPNNIEGIAMAKFVRKIDSRLSIIFTYQEFREPRNDKEYKRYFVVLAESNDSEQSIKELFNHFLYLVEEYSNMPYLEVTGATTF